MMINFFWDLTTQKIFRDITIMEFIIIRLKKIEFTLEEAFKSRTARRCC